MTIVWVDGIKYKLLRPSKPDPDGWVQLVPIKQKAKETKPQCEHTFYNVGLNTGIVTGQRCSKCGYQEWF